MPARQRARHAIERRLLKPETTKGNRRNDRNETKSPKQAKRNPFPFFQSRPSGSLSLLDTPVGLNRLACLRLALNNGNGLVEFQAFDGFVSVVSPVPVASVLQCRNQIN